MKIKIHPLFLALALALIVLGQALGFAALFFAVTLHECAHAFAARERGYVLGELVLLPYGAVLYGEEQFDRASGVIIALAGPLSNLCIAVCVLAIWWLFPATYPYTHIFLQANLSLALFNLLPVFPLDGSRVILSLSKQKARTLKILRIMGIAVSVALFAMFIATAFFEINFSFGILAVFLMLGATSGTRKEMYRFVASAQAKDYSLGVEKRTVFVSADIPLRRLFHFIKTDSMIKFVAVDKTGKQLFEFDEEELHKAGVSHKLSSSVSFALGKNFEGNTVSQNAV